MKPQSAFASLVLAVLLFAGCAISPSELAPQSLDEKYTLGMSAVREVRDGATLLLDTGRMSGSDADNVIRQTDLAEQGIQLAYKTLSQDPHGARAKLEAEQLVLQSLLAYLATKRVLDAHQKEPQK